ncbi:protein ADM2 [Ammospiza maritima maritima]
MRAPAPLALGCVSFALCLLELPHGRALPPRRAPPARSPPERIPALPGAPGSPARPVGRPPGTARPPRGPRRGTAGASSCGTPGGDPRYDPPRWDPRAGRGRRHAGAHLVRVGCVLGTCQVQNLSHRLWQLRGQSGRRDSSPMNPNSPHSYG